MQSLGAATEGKKFELLINDVTRNDGGEYACTASNTHGTATRTINLLVLGKY